METKWRQIGDKLETNWRQPWRQNSDQSLIGKLNIETKISVGDFLTVNPGHLVSMNTQHYFYFMFFTVHNGKSMMTILESSIPTRLISCRLEGHFLSSKQTLARSSLLASLLYAVGDRTNHPLLVKLSSLYRRHRHETPLTTDPLSCGSFVGQSFFAAWIYYPSSMWL